ncbi:hypothetical protein FAZ69_18230 [Trinickia terrae]|uniref:Endonuclease/exonuclease/phosphatase domain-containing protein n=1 Tax=Trinickia terrae TaxID=2571161 RepID=A0A4U1I248_9BURK|nr:hypothetical protein [Trinickia terrae]TKC87271.1 hypothetical protein FAZ69_18230 [Trinickia terrae]
MTRVVFWNLQKFGINKINDPSTERSPGQGGLTDQRASHERGVVVARVLIAANPDIIVLIEVASGDTSPDTLASNSGGMEGLLYLLDGLRAAAPGAGWRLVPPLRIGLGGRSETVGVFYRGALADGDLLYFTGPNGWQGAWAGHSVMPMPGVVIPINPYPVAGLVTPDLSNLLAPQRIVPPNALHNGNAYENMLAARVAYRPVPGFPYAVTGDDFVDFGEYRQPYMVTFTRTDAFGNVRNDLTIFAVHPSPQGILPTQFRTYLTYLQDVVAARGALETRIIGGDFNLRLLAADGADSGAYAPLNDPPNYAYEPLLTSPGAPLDENDLEAFKGYFATHIREAGDLTVDSLFLWSSEEVDSPYPGYGYIGSNFAPDFESVDNILVWPRVDRAYNTTIMNVLTGAPFNEVAPPPAGAPAGGPLPAGNLRSSMTNPAGWNALIVPVPGAVPNFVAIPIPPAPNAPAGYTQGDRNNLTSWANYGHLKSTSDHFAIVADI